jgi:hypothetical protein
MVRKTYGFSNDLLPPADGRHIQRIIAPLPQEIPAGISGGDAGRIRLRS